MIFTVSQPSLNTYQMLEASVWGPANTCMSKQKLKVNNFAKEDEKTPRRRENTRALLKRTTTPRDKRACVREGRVLRQPRVNEFVRSNSLVKWQPIPNTMCSSDTHMYTQHGTNTSRFRRTSACKHTCGAQTLLTITQRTWIHFQSQQQTLFTQEAMWGLHNHSY